MLAKYIGDSRSAQVASNNDRAGRTNMQPQNIMFIYLHLRRVLVYLDTNSTPLLVHRRCRISNHLRTLSFVPNSIRPLALARGVATRIPKASLVVHFSNKDPINTRYQSSSRRKLQSLFEVRGRTHACKVPANMDRDHRKRGDVPLVLI